MTNASVSITLQIPSDPWLGRQVQDFYQRAMEDIQEDTEDSATEAGLAYRRIVRELLPLELSKVNSTWSALNLEPSEKNALAFSVVCEKIVKRTASVSAF